MTAIHQPELVVFLVMHACRHVSIDVFLGLQGLSRSSEGHAAAQLLCRPPACVTSLLSPRSYQIMGILKSCLHYAMPYKSARATCICNLSS